MLLLRIVREVQSCNENELAVLEETSDTQSTDICNLPVSLRRRLQNRSNATSDVTTPSANPCCNETP